MTLLTVDQFREHVETSLVDDAIQRLLDDAEAEIIRYAGDLGSVTELIDGGSSRLVLSRRAGSVTSVTETSGTTTTTLDADDWRLRSAYVLERLNTGTNPRWTWSRFATVTYVAADDTDTRAVVQLELVKIAIARNPGLAAQTIGAWTEQYVNNSAWNPDLERASILARLLDPSIGVV